METINKYTIAHADGVFWVQLEDDNGPYEERLDTKHIDNLACGFVFSVEYKTSRQRKYRQSGCVTRSIIPMLATVAELLKTNNDVIVRTPSLELSFYAD